MSEWTSQGPQGSADSALHPPRGTPFRRNGCVSDRSLAGPSGRRRAGRRNRVRGRSDVGVVPEHVVGVPAGLEGGQSAVLLFAVGGAHPRLVGVALEVQIGTLIGGVGL